MTWLGMASILLLLVFGAMGYARGLIKEVISMVVLVLSVGSVWLINPAISSILKEHTVFYTEVREYCKEGLEKQFDPEIEMGREAQIALIDRLPLPEEIKKGLIANNNSEVYKLLAVDRFTDYVADYVATILTNGAGVVLSFLLSFTILKIMACTLNLVNHVPGLRELNRAAGGVLGIAKGVIILWILGLAATVLCSTPIGKSCMDSIQRDVFLTFLYETNIFVKVFVNVFYNL